MQESAVGRLLRSPISASWRAAGVGPALPFLLLYVVRGGLEIITQTLKHQPVLATALAVAALSPTLTNVFLAQK